MCLGDFRIILWFSFRKEVIIYFKLEYNEDKDLFFKSLRLFLLISCGVI